MYPISYGRPPVIFVCGFDMMVLPTLYTMLYIILKYIYPAIDKLFLS